MTVRPPQQQPTPAASGWHLSASLSQDPLPNTLRRTDGPVLFTLGLVLGGVCPAPHKRISLRYDPCQWCCRDQ